ncbi:protein of unknown function [Ruminococcaceae bacterium FB2012]|nr:protein of unknown function [Ruminococcaceae bacterium FB2012]
MKKSKKGGTVLTAILLILVIILVIILTTAIVREINKKKSENGSTQTGTISANTPTDTDTKSQRNYECKLLSARIGKGYKDEPILICKYEWTNNSDKATDFSFAFYDQAFQNGIECKKAYMVDSLEGERMTNIQPGTTYTVDVPYTLNDNKSEVEIIVKQAFSFEDIEYIHTTVKI